ncbi:MAG: hypothetical protein PHC78_11215, partial [Verrucomicrobiota bacterium]|nr:hypothetical protein [Verrucomicrobiota bacterium]
GDLDGAADELHSALSVNPYYADAWYQLHRIYAEQDNAQMSATAAEAFLSVADPQDPRRNEFHSPTPEPEEPIYQAIPLEELPETVEPEPDSDNDLTDRQPLPGGDA